MVTLHPYLFLLILVHVHTIVVVVIILAFVLPIYCVLFSIGTELLYIQVNFGLSKGVPWFRRLVADLSPWRPGFHPGPVRVWYIVGKFLMGPIFLRQLPFPIAIVIPPMLHPHCLITGSFGALDI